ncbi:3',5'-cyclic-AMP phosphodiesterase [Reinekea sp. G2M2-21]|uniref:3',5'-cyclic-AMP phosphodiesterase n=1 Tax=Reinekea sp. G2M2-21 TaxID=2788942 RepID=UPI0018A94498|nr:3',5'-cyclic-AMP phosphodiesterase [Reinekea sp. G2M2-21]
MQKAFTLVQITDPHLHATQEGTLLGMNTENSLKLIVDQIRQEVSDIDLIIATGDIAQDSSVQAYKNFLRFIDPLNAPMRWIPGNHDSRANMTEAVQGLDHAEPVYVLGDWVVVMLDSIVPERVYGNLAKDQLDILEQALSQYPDKYILVTLHHHPISMHSRWIDQIGVRNRDALTDLLKQHSNVRAVVCGHVHQESDELVNGVRFMSTPSTCVQFKPKSQDFGIDSLGPGFRKLILNPDGTIDTTVSRIEGVDFEIDYSQKGY